MAAAAIGVAIFLAAGSKESPPGSPEGDEALAREGAKNPPHLVRKIDPKDTLPADQKPEKAGPIGPPADRTDQEPVAKPAPDPRVGKGPAQPSGDKEPPAREKPANPVKEKPREEPAPLDGALPRAVLARVKQATVRLEVKVGDGVMLQGSGFFTAAPGVILTNAHVLNMLAPNSRRPLEVAAVLHGGEANGRKLTARILGVDRHSDLAALRVEGDDLPEPLPFGDSKDLHETQAVFIFGFPFGSQLGKDITVTRSSVSSLRKRGTTLHQIQVNGGMHPGNSGGPVTDGRGRVIGVAVSGIRNTQIHFAIPPEAVRRFFSGTSSVSQVTGHRYQDGTAVKLPVHVDLIDPLGRIREVAVALWVGNPGPTRIYQGATEPPAQEGDSARQVIPLPYDPTQGSAEGDVILPPIANPRQVYWMRLVLTDHQGQTSYRNAYSRARVDLVAERKPVNLQYQPVLGGRTAVELVSNSRLKLRTEDGADQSLRCNFKVNLREQTGPRRDGGRVPLTLDFNTCTFTLFIDDKPVPGNAVIQRRLKDLKFMTLNLLTDQDGRPSGGRADLGRVPRDSRPMLGDFAEQLLPSLEMMTLGLPGPTLTPRQTWKVRRDVAVGPLGYAIPARADITYTYVGVRRRDNKSEAIIHLEGVLRGPQGLETRVGGKMSGNLHLATDTGQVVDGGINVQVDCDLRIKNQSARANGTLFVSLKRGEAGPAPLAEASPPREPAQGPAPNRPPADLNGPPRGWQVYNPQDRSFSVWLPAQGGRKRESTRTMHIRGNRLKLNLVQVQLPRGPEYSAATLIMPLRLARRIPRGELYNLFRDIFVESLKGKLTEESDVRQGNVPGKEYVIQTGQGWARLRLFTVGSRVYQALVTGTKAEVQSPNADTFLGSFRTHPRADGAVARDKDRPAKDGAKIPDKPREEPRTNGGGPLWTLDLARMKIPEAPASGKIMGADFRVEGVTQNLFGVTLRQGKGFFADADIVIWVQAKSGQDLAGKRYALSPQSGGQMPRIDLHRLYRGEKLPKGQTFTKGYALKLEFGPVKDGKVAGKIYACLPDADKSVIAGTFTLELK